jgi:predicted enzyme related to lactoylglutathione lyase
MKYMILMYSDPTETKSMSALDREVVSQKHRILRTELTASGELLGGAGLAYPEDSRTIQLRDGVAVRSPGPFVRADQHLTAYHMLDCEALDRALSVAERILDFHVTAVEVRQVHDSVDVAPVTHVSGPDFLALQVRDLERATAFYQQEIGLKRAPTPEGVTGVVVFETSTIPFGLREPLAGTDLEAGPPGLGVSLSLHVDDARALHVHLKNRGVPILTDPFDTPFGLTFVFRDPDGYAIAIHGAG